MRILLAHSVLLVAVWFGCALYAQAPAAGLPANMPEVDVQERLGETLPLDLTFVSHTGESVRLRDYFDGTRPVLLTLNYYGCPMLCGLQLNALTESLRGLDWVAGTNYRIVTVSIDPDEDATLARAKRSSHLEALGQGDDVDWSFLTGDQASISALAAALGYEYEYVEATGEYAHPAALAFVSPDGMISRYLYGLGYEPRDLRMALLEASQGRVGTTVDHLVLACYVYDPNSGSYVRNAFFIMRAGATAGLLALAVLLAALWRFELRKRHARVA